MQGPWCRRAFLRVCHQRTLLLPWSLQPGSKAHAVFASAPISLPLRSCRDPAQMKAQRRRVSAGDATSLLVRQKASDRGAHTPAPEIFLLTLARMHMCTSSGLSPSCMMSTNFREEMTAACSSEVVTVSHGVEHAALPCLPELSLFFPLLQDPSKQGLLLLLIVVLLLY